MRSVFTLIPIPNKPSQENYCECKNPQQIVTNEIQQHIKCILHCDQVELSQECKVGSPYENPLFQYIIPIKEMLASYLMVNN